MLLLAWMALLAVTAVPATQAASISRISGHVIDAESNDPVGGARVRLMFAAPPPPGPARSQPPPEATTDANGEFMFELSTPSRYRLWANKTGYTIPIESPTFDVAAGQSIAGLTLRLSRGGEIAGRVFAPGGDPPLNLIVTALRRRLEANGRIVTSMGQSSLVKADAFRFSALLPGDYVLMARPQSSAVAAQLLPDGRIAFAPTYFPGTAFLEAATTIVVVSGQTIEGLDFMIGPADAHEIAGIVVDDSGRPCRRALVTLTWNRNSEGPMPPTMRFTAADGTFRMTGVAAGNYRLNAIMPVAPRAGDDNFIRGPDGELLIFPAGVAPVSLDVTVSDAIVGGLRLVLPAGRR